VWRLALKEKGLRINRSKKEYIEYEFDIREHINETRSRMTEGRDEVKEVESCKYLGSFVQKN